MSSAHGAQAHIMRPDLAIGGHANWRTNSYRSEGLCIAFPAWGDWERMPDDRAFVLTGSLNKLIARAS